MLYDWCMVHALLFTMGHSPPDTPYIEKDYETPLRLYDLHICGQI